MSLFKFLWREKIRPTLQNEITCGCALTWYLSWLAAFLVVPIRVRLVFMTIRSVLLGLLGAIAICSLSYLNDQILRQTYLVGNNMPVAVYGALMLMVVLVNPILRRFSFTAKELAVILTLTLAACCIPGSGLLRTFTTSLMLPHHYNRLEPGWRDNGILETCPKVMLADVTEENSDEALDGFVQGLGTTEQHIGLRDIPWDA